MKTCAIIPVKQFSKAKTRLDLSIEDTRVLCKLLLEEVLGTISKSSLIEKIILVSKEDEVFQIGKKFDCIEIFDETESGVNMQFRWQILGYLIAILHIQSYFLRIYHS